MATTPEKKHGLSLELGSKGIELKWSRGPCGTKDKKKALQQPGKPERGPISGVMRAVLTTRDNMWDNGVTLTCSFVEPSGTEIQREKVKKVVSQWEKYANVKFEFVESGGMIRIAFEPNEGSWSLVGRQIESVEGNEPTLNLGWIENVEKISDADLGVILHEFGHTLGLLHEHQSPRRGESLTMKKDAVIEYYTRTQGWSVEEVHHQILDLEENVSNFSEMDLTSIMMYFMPGSMNEQNIDVPPNNALSKMDKAFIALNYPYFDNKGPEESMPIKEALDVAGVDGVYRESILGGYEQGDWQAMRASLTHFSTNARLAGMMAELKTSTPTS